MGSNTERKRTKWLMDKLVKFNEMKGSLKEAMKLIIGLQQRV